VPIFELAVITKLAELSLLRLH